MAEGDEVDRWAGNELFAETLEGAQARTLRRVLATWVQGVGADSAESWSCVGHHGAGCWFFRACVLLLIALGYGRLLVFLRLCASVR